MNITSSLSSLSLESLDFLHYSAINVVLMADFGTIVADVKLDIDRDYYDVGESEFFVDSVDIVDVEDDNGEPMKITYDVHKMKNVVESLLQGVMNRPFTSQDERNLILALTY